MDMAKAADGIKKSVFTPAFMGAVQAGLERLTASVSKRGGKGVPIFALLGIGAVIGAGAALMLSPATGKEVRAKLQGLASKLMPSKAKDDGAKDESDQAQSESAKPEGATPGNSHSRRQQRAASSSTS